jgi:hypothetical protein
VSGAVCGIQNTSNFRVSQKNKKNGEAYTDLIEARKVDGIAARGGDSGGPVFTLDGLAVRAKGITVGTTLEYPFRIAVNGRCLDADRNTTGGNGTKVQLWDCNGKPQQMWTSQPDGTLVNRWSGRCLDADRSTTGGNGTKVQLWDCNGDVQQQWDSLGDGSHPMRVAWTGRCLDADLNTIRRNGTKVQLWDCNGQRQQSWRTNRTSFIYQDFRTANRDFGVETLNQPPIVFRHS